MTRELSVVLTGEDREVGALLDHIRKIKSVPIHVEVVSLSNLKQTMERVKPQLVIYDADGNVDVVKKAVVPISEEFSDVPWAIVSKETNIDVALDFFRMGAIDYLKEPVAATDVRRLIEKVVDLEDRSTPASKNDAQQTIAFFSTKGGVGLTMLASNLADEMARQNRGKVLLMDLVLQHGNVSDMLDVPSTYTLMDVIENFERLDSNLVENSLVKHKSGFYVLPCPKQPEDEEFIASNQTKEVFQFFKGEFPFVIADVGHEFTKPAIAFMDVADVILLVTTPDVPSLYNTRNAVETLRRLGYNNGKVKVVLNRNRMKGAIDARVIQKNLSMDMFCEIQDDQSTCLAAINQGKTLHEVAKSCDVAKGIHQLASALIAQDKKGGVGHVASSKA